MISQLLTIGLLLSCLDPCVAQQPSYYHKTFNFTQSITTRYATPAPSKAITTYAKAYSDVSSAFANQSSSTWPNWTPSSSTSSVNSTSTVAPYADEAYFSLWNAANPTNFSRGIFSTTVSPTPVATSELLLPPSHEYISHPNRTYQFPSGFILAAAGSAAQCEGAIADEGKSPSLLDMLYTVLSKYASGLVNTQEVAGVSLSSPEPLAPDYVTNEHYYLYRQDIDRFAAIGLKHYSFSIPMTRILPFALPGTPVNEQAINHYDDMINYILQKGLQPIITLYHWDTPLQFYDGPIGLVETLASALTNSTYGLVPGFSFGLQNTTFVDAFVNYAQIVMSRYGDRVPLWVTFNEPQVGCTNGVAINTVITAHAKVVHWYRSTLNGTGQISMKMGIPPGLPADLSNSSHVEATGIFNDIYLAPFLNPLVLGEDFPSNYKIAVPDYVPLTAEDLEFMSGTMDYISYDIYNPALVEPLVSDWEACAMNSSLAANPNRRFPICLNVATETTTGWAQGWTAQSGSAVTTSTLRSQLNYFWNVYQRPVVISETGLQTPLPASGIDQNLFNVPQSLFLLNELKQVLQAIWEDGVDVMGMFVWNWGDDWEFTYMDFGFGLQFVNHTTQERIYRRSFFDVIEFVESRRQQC